MSRQHRNNSPEARIAVMKAVAKTVDAAESVRGSAMNHLVERTGEAIILLSGYISCRIEVMMDGIEGTSPFVQRLRNRSNNIVRACDEFARAFEPYIKGDEKKKAYLWFSDVISNALDSLFDDMHRDEPDATMQVRRRAKLRYHDPYPEHVKECTYAFEDGYTKGYTDAMADFIKEVAKLGDGTDRNLSVGIVDGKITIKPI